MRHFSLSVSTIVICFLFKEFFKLFRRPKVFCNLFFFLYQNMEECLEVTTTKALQWNSVITNLVITNSVITNSVITNSVITNSVITNSVITNFHLYRTHFFSFFSPKSMFTIKSNSVITNSGYSKQICPVPSMFVITEFHCSFLRKFKQKNEWQTDKETKRQRDKMSDILTTVLLTFSITYGSVAV
jgi:hypothetical protein